MRKDRQRDRGTDYEQRAAVEHSARTQTVIHGSSSFKTGDPGVSLIRHPS